MFPDPQALEQELKLLDADLAAVREQLAEAARFVSEPEGASELVEAFRARLLQSVATLEGRIGLLKQLSTKGS